METKLDHPDMNAIRAGVRPIVSCPGSFAPEVVHRLDDVKAREAGPALRCSRCGFYLPLPRGAEFKYEMNERSNQK